ncbi:MAG: zinc ribbon domain-containing protein [Acidobacteria bacterium]|nr:zinc ribbon domain-containing protein [Acidobacteriota bacterium]
MSSVPCTHCGAAITPGTKFCRKCGQPSLDAASVSEAATRVFEATADRTAPTQTWNAQPTGPAYLSPTGGASPLEDMTTKSLEATGRKQKSTLAVAIIAILLAVFALFAIGMILRGRNAQPTQAPPAAAATGPETVLPPLPPLPPHPSGEPPASGASTSTSELIYPGAETVMDMKNSRENFLELRTSDPLDRVVDWYTTKIKAAEIIRTRGTEAILRSGKTSVIISSRGNATNILIKQGVEN